MPADGESERVAVNGEVFSRKVLVRKDFLGENSGEGTFGSWMIGQRKENKYGKNIKGRIDYRNNQEGKEGKKTMEVRGKRNKDDLEINSRFNALYDLEEEIGEFNGLDKEESGLRSNKAQNKERKEKKKELRNRSPISDQNIEETNRDSLKEQGQKSEDRQGIKQWREKKEKANQDAAVNEHVVVRETNKGQHITRMTVASQDTNIEEYEDITMDEHHNDPPHEVDQGEAMMMELEEFNGMNRFQSGLGAEGRAAF